MLNIKDRITIAYIVGVALGDGNLSNPNGRAVRLRITCDSKYPKLICKIEKALKKIAPYNRVSRIFRKDNSIDISCYSNQWEEILGWKAKNGSKVKQGIKVPDWILKDRKLTKACLCGLIETDGSIYKDRKYLTANFVTQIPSLAESVDKMLRNLKYSASKQVLPLSQDYAKFTFRIHKNANLFIKDLRIIKS